MKRIVSGIVLTLLLVSVFVLAFKIQPVKASGTIYIRAGGSIEPSGAPISTFDNVTYTLTDNITSYGDGIIVERDNIIIDGCRYTIQGRTAFDGIDLTGRSNVTVKNTTISDFHCGIYLSQTNKTTLNGNSITASSDYGIWLSSSSGNSIIGNNVTNGGGGIGLYCSSSNGVIGNSMAANHGFIIWLPDDNWSYFDCIGLYGSDSNSIIGNSMTANSCYSIGLYDSDSNSISGNNVTNGGGGILLSSSSSNGVIGNSMTANHGYSIGLYDSDSNSISGNNITANVYGILLSSSSNNTLANNIMITNRLNFVVTGGFVNDVDTTNTVDGKTIYYWINRNSVAVPSDAGYVALVNCTDITAQNLNLTNNGQGLVLICTTNSTITNNHISGNGIWLRDGHGILLSSSSNNSIGGNSITASSDYGIWLSSSSGNSIIGNNVTNGGGGIGLSSFSNCNGISRNSITNTDASGIGLWDSSNNNVAGNNIAYNGGIGISYDWQSSNNSIAGNNIAYNSWGIGQGSPNNRIYHNNFINNTSQVGGSSYANTWDYGYPSGGNYWSDYKGTDQYSGPYQNGTGSDGIGDTTYIDAIKIIEDRYPLMNPYATLLGDLNGDGKVDTFDVSAIAVAFGSTPGHPRWNPTADIAGPNNVPDGKIDLRDIALIAQNFGRHR